VPHPWITTLLVSLSFATRWRLPEFCTYFRIARPRQIRRPEGKSVDPDRLSSDNLLDIRDKANDNPLNPSSGRRSPSNQGIQSSIKGGRLMRIRHRSSWLRTRIARRFAFIVAAIVACMTCAARESAASPYEFFVNDGAGDVGYGFLNTTSANGWGDDSQLATSGSLTITATQNPGLLSTGTYPLIPTPGGTVTTSGTGDFFGDSLVYPAQDADLGMNNSNLSGPSYLTNDGLLFGQNGVFEINIWGNGNSVYQLYTGTPGLNFGIQASGAGSSFSLMLIPEPSSIVALCGLGAMGLIFSVRRRRKC
jgi:hypothetical protein